MRIGDGRRDAHATSAVCVVPYGCDRPWGHPGGCGLGLIVVLDPYDPRGINDHGDIVGTYSDATGVHGFFLSDGIVTVIDPPACPTPMPPAGPGSRSALIAFSVNNRGHVVGNQRPCGAGVPGHGFFWADGVLTTLDHPDGALTLRGINDAGVMVGYVDHNGIIGSVLLSRGLSPRCQPPDESDDIPAAFGLNNRGDIVGELGLDGFLWSKGQYTRLRVPGSVRTEALGINDRGDIIGWWDGCGGPSPWLSSLTGADTAIQVPGAHSTQVFGGNNRRQVVGLYAVEGHEAQHGFVWQVAHAPASGGLEDADHPEAPGAHGPVSATS